MAKKPRGLNKSPSQVPALIVRARKLKTKTMQQVREGLLQNLEQVFLIAKKQVDADRKTSRPKIRQEWIRVMAYVAQVANSVTRTFDEAEIDKELGELEKMVLEVTAKSKAARNKGKSAGA